MCSFILPLRDVEPTPRQGDVHGESFDWNIFFSDDGHEKIIKHYKTVAKREVKEDTAVGFRSAADPTLIDQVVKGPLVCGFKHSN